jgi:hypothetical protein
VRLGWRIKRGDLGIWADDIVEDATKNDAVLEDVVDLEGGVVRLVRTAVEAGGSRCSSGVAPVVVSTALAVTLLKWGSSGGGGGVL